MKKTIPAVSIIIPMYNAEKYVGECLDSILAQTFKDYEVIVVDDCSTDKSCEIVESYIPKFKGRLQLIRSEKNSGGCAIPRNIGMRFACGKYIYFMDSDDAITKTALEELYNLAEEFGADIVHCEKWYEVPEDPIKIDKKLFKENSWQKGSFVDKPTLMTDDLAERVKLFVEKKFCWMAWTNLINREYLVKKNINFYDLRVSEDVLFTFNMLCTNSKVIRVPNIFYIWRTRKDSQYRAVLPVEKRIHRRIRDVFLAITHLDKFMEDIKFFVENPNARYAVLEFYKNLQSYDVLPLYAQIPAWQLDHLIRRELNEVKDKTALTAFLFARMNILNVQLNQAVNLLNLRPKTAQDFQRQQMQFQQQQAIIRQQAAQLQQLQQQLKNVHDIFK